MSKIKITKDELNNHVKNILNPSIREHDLLQSYVVNSDSTKESKDERISKLKKSTGDKNCNNIDGLKKLKIGAKARVNKSDNMKLYKLRRKRRRRSSDAHRQEEVYTDKDRAAAVNMGSKDIKQSLSMKQRQDRSETLQIPEDTEPGALLILGIREMKIGDVRVGLNCINKALDLSENDTNALIARSKCYLLLGKPHEALQDAEQVLQSKSNNCNIAKAMYYKAEALYYLGDYEMSLVFYHRGMRIRPEFTQFRLGVQKAKQAIRHTLGN